MKEAILPLQLFKQNETAPAGDPLMPKSYMSGLPPIFESPDPHKIDPIEGGKNEMDNKNNEEILIDGPKGYIKRLKRDLLLVVNGSQGHVHINSSWAANLLQEIEILQSNKDRLEKKLQKIKEIASDH